MSANVFSLGAKPLIAGITLTVAVAALAISSTSPTEAVVPTCLGKPATIVGTTKSEVIRGTRRADVIVAKGGNDTIIGRGGNDLICAGGGNDIVRAGGGRDTVVGGSGADVLQGDAGNDVLRGSAGDDIVKGGDGDDAIDGGLGFDTCDQGAGIGSIVNCERIEVPIDPIDPPAPPASRADLSVAISGPKKARSGPLTFVVRVRNLGPDASAYVLDLGYASRRARCVAPSWMGNHEQSTLRAGTSRVSEYVIDCAKQRKGASVSVTATVAAKGTDPNPVNDTASARAGLR